MLDSAHTYCNIFNDLMIHDFNYEDCPSDDEWTKTARCHKFFKIFYDATNVFWAHLIPHTVCIFKGCGTYNDVCMRW